MADAHWNLGGKICNLRGSFVYPRLDLIDNELYADVPLLSDCTLMDVLGSLCTMITSMARMGESSKVAAAARRRFLSSVVGCIFLFHFILSHDQQNSRYHVNDEHEFRGPSK